MKTLFPWSPRKQLRSRESRSPCQSVASPPALCPISAAGLRHSVSGMTVFSLGEDRTAGANFSQNRLLGRKPEAVAREVHSGSGTAVPRRRPARFHMISIREGHPAVSHHLTTSAKHILVSTKHPVFQVSCISPPRSLFLPLGAHLMYSNTHGSTLQGQLLPRTFTSGYSLQNVWEPFQC